ncbi:hypothetical protein SeLEV6574_g08622, partial [Synchytrium endobioticum]
CGAISYSAALFNQGDPRPVLQEYESNRAGLLSHAKILIAAKKGVYLPNSDIHQRPQHSVNNGPPPPSFRAESERLQKVRDSVDKDKVQNESTDKPLGGTDSHRETGDKSHDAAGFIYIGSANCTQSAWGAALTNTGKIRMKNAELGICFPFDKSGSGIGCAKGMAFQTPCVLPGKLYESSDEPWLTWM